MDDNIRQTICRILGTNDIPEHVSEYYRKAKYKMDMIGCNRFSPAELVLLVMQSVLHAEVTGSVTASTSTEKENAFLGEESEADGCGMTGTRRGHIDWRKIKRGDNVRVWWDEGDHTGVFEILCRGADEGKARVRVQGDEGASYREIPLGDIWFMA